MDNVNPKSPSDIPVTDLTKDDPRLDPRSPQYDENFARLRGYPPTHVAPVEPPE